MCTAKEGKLLDRTFLRYYYGRKVDDSDHAVLDKLCRASFIKYYMKDGTLYACATETGRSLKPRLVPRIRLLMGRV